MSDPIDAGARRAILARRARFMAAALAGVGGCHPAPPAEPPPSVVNIGAPKPEPTRGSGGSAHVDTDADAGAGALPPRAKARDRDGDGVLDDDDRCPDEPGSSHYDSDRLGCPVSRPMVCLSEL